MVLIVPSTARPIAIEGNFAAGKSTLLQRLVRDLTDDGYTVECCPEFLIDTNVLDSDLFGQGIYVVQDCMKSAYRSDDVDVYLIERYMLSTLAHHYTVGVRSFDAACELYESLVRSGLLTVPQQNLVCLRPMESILASLRDRGWDYPIAYLERQQEFFTAHAASLAELVGPIALVDGSAPSDVWSD
jgi:thymidylate kinase